RQKTRAEGIDETLRRSNRVDGLADHQARVLAQARNGPQVAIRSKVTAIRYAIGTYDFGFQGCGAIAERNRPAAQHDMAIRDRFSYRDCHRRALRRHLSG